MKIECTTNSKSNIATEELRAEALDERLCIHRNRRPSNPKKTTPKLPIAPRAAYVYIYIYRERERDRYIYIYIYVGDRRAPRGSTRGTQTAARGSSASSPK